MKKPEELDEQVCEALGVPPTRISYGIGCRRFDPEGMDVSYSIDSRTEAEAILAKHRERWDFAADWDVMEWRRYPKVSTDLNAALPLLRRMTRWEITGIDEGDEGRKVRVEVHTGTSRGAAYCQPGGEARAICRAIQAALRVPEQRQREEV